MKHLFKLTLCAAMFAMTANTSFAQAQQGGLKDAYKDYFTIGVAVNMRNVSTPEHIELIKQNYNSITAENDMKPQPTEPEEGKFNWRNADRLLTSAVRTVFLFVVIHWYGITKLVVGCSTTTRANWWTRKCCSNV